MGRPVKIIRLTLHQAAQEFDLDDKTLAKRLKEQNIVPDEAGCYSIAQVEKAKWGDLEGDRIRAQTRQSEEAARHTAVKTANLLRENIPADMVEKVIAELMIDLRQKVTYAEIPDKSKQDILKDLQAVPIDNYFKAADAEEDDEE